MKTEERFPCHPDDFRNYNSQRIHDEFLIDNLFVADGENFVYSHFDRFITGGILPVNKRLLLEPFNALKASYFLERREAGIINIGGKGKIVTDHESFELNYKDALYLGKETRDVSFESLDKSNPAKFYFNSTPAHAKYPSKLIRFDQADKVEMGSAEAANHRQINKLIVNSILPTCQLQMGLTELKQGSVWNTMPPHTHARRMEVYFYFNVPENQSICHYMGRPDETRHIWLQNEQAVISPSWSIHSGAGTSNYSFIWGMAGENLDFSDMDGLQISQLR